MNVNIKKFNKILYSVIVAMATFFMAFILNTVHADAEMYYDEFVLDQGLDEYSNDNFSIFGTGDSNGMRMSCSDNNSINICINDFDDIDSIEAVQLTFYCLYPGQFIGSSETDYWIDDCNLLMYGVDDEWFYLYCDGIVSAVKIIYERDGHMWTDHTVNGATITSTCGAYVCENIGYRCSLSDRKVSLTLKADEVAFSGSSITKADLFKSMDFDTYNSARGMKLSINDIVLYAKDDTKKTAITEITSDGWYVAELTVGGLTAKLEFFVPTGNTSACNEDILEGTKIWNCGKTVSDSVQAHIHSDGTLHVFGVGMMEDFDDANSKADWKNYAENITKISIDEDVTGIGSYAFYGLTNVKEAVIPDSVTSVGVYALASCSSLESVIIPGSVKVLNANLFSGCSKLSDIVIMNGVKEIGCHAFRGCSGLSSIIFPASVQSLGEEIFVGCNKLSSITFCGTTCPSISDTTFYYRNAETITFELASTGTVYIPQNSDYTSEKFNMKNGFESGSWKFVTSDCQHTSDINNDGYCDYCGMKTDEMVVILSGYSLSLNGDIGVDIYMELTDVAKKAGNARLAVTFDGVTEYIPVSEALSVTLNEKTYTVFPFSVPAKDYRKEITIQLEAGEKKSYEYTITVEKYASYIINHSGRYDSKTVELAEKLVYYCAAADTYFNSADSIKTYYNKDYTEAVSAVEGAGNTSFDDTYIGSSLILKDKVTIRHYYSGSVPEELQSKATAVEGAYYYMDYEGIAPDKYDEKFDGGYSVYSYLSAVLSGENIDTGLKDLAVAMYQYSVAAKAYNAQAAAK